MLIFIGETDGFEPIPAVVILSSGVAFELWRSLGLLQLVDVGTGARALGPGYGSWRQPGGHGWND